MDVKNLNNVYLSTHIKIWEDPYHSVDELVVLGEKGRRLSFFTLYADLCTVCMALCDKSTSLNNIF